MGLRLRIVSPCDQEGVEVEPTARDRHCAKCDRQVHNLSALSPSEAQRLLAHAADERLCVQYVENERGEVVFGHAPCPSESPRIRAFAAAHAAVVVTTMLTGCSSPRSPGAPNDGPYLSTVAGCSSNEEWPMFPFIEPEKLKASSQGVVTDICEITPDAPTCAPITFATALRLRGDEIPAHLRGECHGMFLARGFGIVTEWPEGPDVVVAAVAADGVALGNARHAALRMLEPLGRCYAAHVDARTKTAPQGRIVILAGIAPDGSVLEANAEASEGLPRALVDCAVAALRAERFGPADELATVEMDLRLVFRVMGGTSINH
jgi:hypothetical protein